MVTPAPYDGFGSRSGGFPGSELASRAFLGAGLGILLLLAARPEQAITDETIQTFVCDTVRGWRARYGATGDLRVVHVEVRFGEELRNFSHGQALVVAPAGFTLFGAQEVIDDLGSRTALE